MSNANPDRRSVPAHHRYTGPELSALLNQVRRELGTEANIVEANRVRSGGVGGFFAKESYEVVAAAAPVPFAATTRRAVEAPEADPEPLSPVPGVATPAAPTPTPEPARAPSQATPAPPSPAAPTPAAPAPVVAVAAAAAPAARSTEPSPNPRHTPGISVALLERAEAVSALERVSLRRESIADTYDLREPAPARFDDVLEAELTKPDPRPDPEPAAAKPMPAPPPVVERPPVADPAPLIVAEPVPTPAPEPVSSAAPPIVAEPPIDLDQLPITPEEPWAGGRLVTIVGSLNAAIASAERLVNDDRSGYVEYVVLTPDTTSVELPSTRVGTHYEAVSRRLFDWTTRGRSGIVVIDAALGSRLSAEVRCVRNLGSGLVRVIDDAAAPAFKTLELLADVDGTIVVDPDDRLADA